MIKTSSAKQTKELAKKLAKNLIKRMSSKKALVLALTGELGSGKTTFAQGFLRALGIRGPITSPTFIIMKKFHIRVNPRNYPRSSASTIYHIDCYRIKKPRELTTLGLKEILSNPQNIVLIEWAEKISTEGGPASGGKKLLPKNTIWLKFEHGKKENQRVIILKKRKARRMRSTSQRTPARSIQ